MKRTLTYTLAFLCLLCCNGQTPYKVMLKDNAFKNDVFPFRIIKVIDGRLNPHKPVGRYSYLVNLRSIVNDSLGSNMTRYFREHTDNFDAADPIILVINQLEFARFSTLKLSVDFYRLRHDSCFLVFKQYYQRPFDMPFYNIDYINTVFSSGVRDCLKLFRNQPGCESFKEAYPDTTTFFRSFLRPPTPQANMANIKDGIYFSVKELYLNRPGLTGEYTLASASEAGKQRIHITSKLHDLYAVYAVVKNGRIFIILSTELYAEAAISPFGSLYFVNVYKPAFDRQGVNTKQPLDKTGIDFETGGWIFPFY